MRKRMIFKMIAQAFIMLVAMVCGGAVMAVAPEGSPLQGGGTSVEGGQTRSNVEPHADPEFYAKDVDQRIAKIRPQSTVIDTISRQVARRRKADALEVKVYEMGSRAIKTQLSETTTEQTSGQTMELNVDDNKIFTYGDQILVDDVTGYETDGKTPSTKNLVLLVTGKVEATGKPTVMALNGLADSNGGQSWIPALTKGTTLTRMAKACAESDAQVPAFALVPTSRTNYCQNYMFQITQSIIDKMSNKEVPFSLTDVEIEAVYDMKRGQEISRLFSTKKVIVHPTKNEQVYTTDGLWYQAGKDFVLSTEEDGSVSAGTMIDLMKYINTGMGAGSKKKVLVAGSDLVSAITKMALDKVRVLKQDIHKEWDVEFTSLRAFSGQLLLVHSEIFDETGRSNSGLIIDPDELTLATFMPFTRTPLDLKKSGISNSESVVFQQIDCLYIANRYTACRVKLG